ncbi:MAG: YybS family protein [Synergistaceae bacterium]|nr:YybS family protein [Synergistaceae bacterium]
MLFALGLKAPALALPLMLIYPFPSASLSYERGLVPSALSAVFASTAMVLFLPPVFSLIYFIMFGLSGVIIGTLARRIRASAELLLAAVVAALACKLLSAFVVFAASGVNLMAPDAAEIEKAILSLVESGAFALSGMDAERMRSEISSIVSYIILLIPFNMILFSSVEALICLFLASHAHSRRGGGGFFSLPPFGSWRFPKNILLALVVGFLCASAPEEGRYYVFHQVGINLNALTRTLFILQGLSMACFFMERRGFPKFLRAVMIALAPLVSILGDICAVFGLLDIIFDFRKRARGLEK